MSAHETKPERIELKDHVPEEDRTPGKDAAAEFIAEEVVAEGRWPMDYTAISNESGWSRQHVRNTVQDYFREVDPAEGDEREGHAGEDVAADTTLTIPDDVGCTEDFLRGVVAGRRLE